MSTYAYDLEVFSNFFSGVFKNIDNTSDTKYFVIHPKRNDSESLHQFLNTNPTLVGYNNSKYDDLILNLILQKDITSDNQRIYNASSYIINTEKLFEDKKTYKLLFPDFYSIDLMKILGFDKLRIGLKQVSINLRYHLIQDLPKHHDEEINSDEIQDILSYNENDVDITLKLYHKLLNEIRMREQISELYNIDLINCSNSLIADKLMSKFYCDYTGQKFKDIKDINTERKTVKLSSVVNSNIYFSTKVFSNTLDKVNNYVVGENEEKEIDNPILNGKRYRVGLGGLHSDNPPEIYESSDDYELIDADVASYYPNLMITNKVKPAHLDDSFINLYKEMVDERLRAKANKKNDSTDAVKADALKIVANSIFGKLGFQFSWLYDLKALYSITINGQLYLLMLIEWLENEGIEVIYANTDGISVKVHKDKKDRFYEICKEWESHTSLELEYAYYKKMILRDVNNYLILKTDGSPKEKGAFITKRSELPVVNELSQAYLMPVIPEAVYQFFVNGKTPEKFIPTVTDIYEFCMSQKVGRQYEIHYFQLEYDEKGLPEEKLYKLQKTNRFYVSTNGGKLMKYKLDPGSYENLVKNRKVTILNHYQGEKEWNIDYNYYISQAWKMINSCTNNFQTDLFK